MRRLVPVLTPLFAVVALALSAGTALALWSDTATNFGNALGTQSLDPPSGLSAVASGDDVALSWSATPDLWATGYQVWRGTSPGCCYSLHDTVPGQGSTGYTDVGANLGPPSLIGSWATGLTHTAPAGDSRALVVIAGSEEDYTTVALGTAWKATPTASTETPSMLHSGPNRQAIAAVRLHDDVSAVGLLGSWGTDLSHSAPAGSGRLLVLIVGNEENPGPSPTLSAVTYGGQAMTKVTAVSIGSGVDGRVEIWVLNEAGIAAATGSTFVPSWSSPPMYPLYSHAFFDDVDQGTPFSSAQTNSSASSTPNPITTSDISTDPGDVVVTGAVAGTNGSYTPQNGFTLGNNQERFEEVRLASLTYGGQPLTFITRAQVETSASGTAVEAWILTEAGIAAATDSTLVPTWDIPPDGPAYSHAFFADVDQATPVGASAIATAPGATPNPITTAGLSTTTADFVITGAFGGNSGTYTPQNGFVLGTNENPASSTLGSAYKAAGGGTETPSMQHDDPGRQVILGFVLQGGGSGDTYYYVLRAYFQSWSSVNSNEDSCC